MLRDPAPPLRSDSLAENGEVEVPAQAADDPVVGHAQGEVVVIVLGEGDGVGTPVAFLQEEFQGDVELALVVLHNSQIRQVRLEQPVQGLQLVGVQQAIVDGPGAQGECQERERSLCRVREPQGPGWGSGAGSTAHTVPAQHT